MYKRLSLRVQKEPTWIEDRIAVILAVARYLLGCSSLIASSSKVTSDRHLYVYRCCDVKPKHNDCVQ